MKTEANELINNHKEALRAYQNFITLDGEIEISNYQKSVDFLNHKFDSEKRMIIEMENKEKQNIILLCICGIVTILSIMIYVCYNLLKTKHNLIKSLAETRKLRIKNLEEEREILTRTISDLESNPINPSLMDVLKERLNLINELAVYNITDRHSAKSYDKWIKYLFENKDDFVQATVNTFRISHPGFIEFLEQANLTQNEMNHICLYALGLTGVEIGKYLKTSSQYNINMSIRKKLGLNTSDKYLRSYIQKILKSY